MPKALVCINTDSFAAEEVLEEIRIYQGVEEAYRVAASTMLSPKSAGDKRQSLRHSD